MNGVRSEEDGKWPPDRYRMLCLETLLRPEPAE